MLNSHNVFIVPYLMSAYLILIYYEIIIVRLGQWLLFVAFVGLWVTLAHKFTIRTNVFIMFIQACFWNLDTIILKLTWLHYQRNCFPWTKEIFATLGHGPPWMKMIPQYSHCIISCCLFFVFISSYSWENLSIMTFTLMKRSFKVIRNNNCWVFWVYVYGRNINYLV